MPIRTFRSVLLVSLSSLALAACGSQSSPSAHKTSAPLPPITEMDAAAATAPASQAPLPLTDSDTLTPVLPLAAAPAATTATAASPMEERIAQLEQSVESLRADYARIMPAFASLNTTNERIQTLLDQMESEGKIPPAIAATRAEPAAAVASAAPAPKVAAPAAPMKIQPSEEDLAMAAEEEPVAPEQPEASAAASAPSSAALSNTVTSVRVGEHSAKTRLVLDLTAKTKPEFKYDLDNGEKILMVELPGSAWTGKTSGKPNSPLIAGWNAQKGPSGGSAVAIQLKKNARVLSTEFLGPQGKDPSRLVLDIASDG